jgi:hypothetical protein
MGKLPGAAGPFSSQPSGLWLDESHVIYGTGHQDGKWNSRKSAQSGRRRQFPPKDAALQRKDALKISGRLGAFRFSR